MASTDEKKGAGGDENKSATAKTPVQQTSASSLSNLSKVIDLCELALCTDRSSISARPPPLSLETL